MLQYGSKFYAVLLVGALLAGSGLLVSASAVPSASAAGCHGHSRSTPARQPVSYQCCAVGHSPALQPDISASLILVGPVISVNAPLLLAVPEYPVIELRKIAVSPPPLIPLRI